MYYRFFKNKKNLVKDKLSPYSSGCEENVLYINTVDGTSPVYVLFCFIL